MKKGGKHLIGIYICHIIKELGIETCYVIQLLLMTSFYIANTNHLDAQLHLSLKFDRVMMQDDIIKQFYRETSEQFSWNQIWVDIYQIHTHIPRLTLKRLY